MNAGFTSPAQALSCPKCRLAIDPNGIAPGAALDCPACRSNLSFTIFPALAHPPETVSTASGEHALEGEAVCFFHGEKRATVACQRCGRFLCSLCDVPFGGRHLCPSCLDVTKMPELIKRRWIGPQTALFLGMGPICFFFICFFMWPLLPFSGLAAIVVALWSWRKPPSLVHGSRRWMSILGLLGGIGQVAGVAIFVAFLAGSFRGR
jgi:hypothetical protein